MRNKERKLIIEMSSQDKAERLIITEAAEVQSLIDQLYIEALEMIENKLGYPIDLEPEHTTGPHKGTKKGLVIYANYLPERIYGWYSWKGEIDLNFSLIRDMQENPNLPGRKDKVLSVLIHEIGHRIHDIHFGYKTVRLPREGRTRYAETNARENFAEAFENLITDRGTRFAKRNEALTKVLNLKFKPELVPTAAKKNTIPESRKTLLTLDQICEEIGMTTKAARVKLRKSGKFTKGPSGWAWEPTDTENITIIKNYLLGVK